MSGTYEHWRGKCICGQIIGDSGRLFRKLVHSEKMPAYDAAKSLGYVNMCCLDSLSGPTVVDVRTAHTGFISTKVTNPDLSIQSYSTKDIIPLEGEESSVGVISSREEKMPPLSSTGKAEESSIYASIQGISEPRGKPGIKMGDLKRGDVYVTGYAVDEDDGKPVMIHVGEGYYVPLITYSVRIAQNRVPGFYNKDIDFP
jgi:hypothetical protein